jgi:hypothetical protein
MLAVARRRFGDEVELISASADTLPLDSESFDHLTFTYLFRYVPDPGATLADRSPPGWPRCRSLSNRDVRPPVLGVAAIAVMIEHF